jgi:C4-dicarboxylate-specific signal transduction histidine kinase
MSSAPVPDEADILGRMRRHRLHGLSEMAAGMAHEINQPLGGIRGFAEGILIGLEEGWDISHEEIKGKMRRIIAEADRIDDLIQGVRGFADEDARLDLVQVDVHTATQAAVRLMGTRIQAQGIELAVAVRGLPAVVRANPFALQEVMQILLANARDACLERRAVEGPAIAVTIDGGASAAEPVLVTIADNGAGMDAAILARAGEPFFTTKGPDRGVGLGLAMARGILGQCDGRLELGSQAGAGTSATVYLRHRSGTKDGQ